jgi:hypothetical protein
MKIARATVGSLLSVMFGLVAFAPALAQVGEPASDITIGSVRLTHRLVLRVEATYTCPVGFEPTPSTPPPTASASQQSDLDPSSRDKEFGPVVCDGASHDVALRFARPRDPRGAVWEFGAITQVEVFFYASQPQSPFAWTNPQEVRSVITVPSADATVAGSVTVERVSLTDRDALRVEAVYTCPSDMALVEGCGPTPWPCRAAARATPGLRSGSGTSNVTAHGTISSSGSRIPDTPMARRGRRIRGPGW